MNKFKKIKKFYVLEAVMLLISLSVSCKSIKKPENISEILDYSNDDVKRNEINSIRTLLESNPVKALWKAIALGDDEFISECKDVVFLQLQKSINEKDLYEAKRYACSLMSVGFSVDDEMLNTLSADDIPGFTVDESKLPHTISDCINATVTVWVDKGYKVENGAGIADIVIGSGFFIDKRGYLVTNHHVIKDLVDPTYEGYSRVYVKLPSDMDTKIPAKVVGYDSILDLALLKVEIEPNFVFALGSSSELSVGDKVSAIGTPIGLEGTLTSGIISSVDRKLTVLGNIFQLDAAVNSGNSGGPLIDENKRVQAIVFAGMLQFQGLNFAIPVEYLRQELPYLYQGGDINHSWIGAYGHTKKIKGVKSGLEVQYLLPAGSAYFSGLKENDIIIQIDDKDIFSIDDFQYVLMAYEPNTIIKCTYKNEAGEIKSIPVFLEKRPKYPLEDFYNSDLIQNTFIPIFGMQLAHSSTINRKSYTIEKVISGTAADDAGFSENDPITIQATKFDYEHEYFMAQLFVQRRKKGFIDMTITLGAPLDCPYYF